MHCPRSRHGCGAHALAQVFGQAWGRRFLEHFLMAPLHRAVALKKIDAIAMRIGEHLDLDMARTLHILFDQHRIIAKAVLRFALARGQSD